MPLLFSWLSLSLAIWAPVASSLPQPAGNAGTAIPTLNVLAKINSAGYANVLEADQARARYIQSVASESIAQTPNFRRASSFPVQHAIVTYTANVGVGTPPTSYSLVIDTGSSNTWVGAGKPYQKTSSSKPLNQPVAIAYGTGSFSGSEFLDTVTLSPGLVIENQSIGVANRSDGLQGFDGILGLGPVGLTSGTTPEPTIPTVTDNLFANGAIETESLGIFFTPATANSTTGELTFGGFDTTKTRSPIHFVPITQTPPSSRFWGINQTITYGSTAILSNGAGVMDSGTTLLLLATEIFTIYKTATGGQFDPATGLLSLTPQQFADLKPLDLNIGDQLFSLSPNAQIWPRSLNVDIGGNPNTIYLAIGDLGLRSGQGLDFVSGLAFHERFYVAHDIAGNQVGFATTEFTDANIN